MQFHRADLHVEISGLCVAIPYIMEAAILAVSTVVDRLFPCSMGLDTTKEQKEDT